MRTRWIPLAAALALGGCSSDGGDGEPLAPARMIAVGYNLLAVAGHGEVVAALDYDGTSGGSFDAIIRLFHRDPSAPTELLDLGAVTLAGVSVNPVDDFRVTADWLTVCAGGMTAAVSLTTTPPQAIATLGTGPGTRALASGRWLLYVQGRMLAVRDLEAPNTGFPQVGSQLDAGSPVTGLAPAPDGFYVFTNEGFGHLSMQGGAPVYERFASEAIRLYAKAYLDGTKLHVGGPSHYLGKIRVARLDVSTPGSPAVEGFADVEGVWGDFAYDGAGAYAVLGSLANGWNAYSLSVLRTSGQAIVPGATADLRVVREDVSVCHAAGGILYTAYDTPTPGGGSYAPSDLALWSLP